MTKTSRKRRASQRIKDTENGTPERCSLEAEMIFAAAKEGDLPRFKVTAYHGGALRVAGFKYPVYVELASANFERDSTNVNMDHDQKKPVGHTVEQNIDAEGIHFAGVFSVPGEERDRVVEAAKNEFVWNASIECEFPPAELVPRGRLARVNGRQITGPAYIARRVTVTGFAVLNRGADRQTRFAIAAQHSVPTRKRTMKKELREFIEAAGYDADQVAENEQQLEVFEATFSKLPEPKKEDAKEDWSKMIASQREAAAAEAERVGDIYRICAKYQEPEIENANGEKVSLAAHAIKTGMSAKECELDAKLYSLEAQHSGLLPAIHNACARDGDTEIIECSLVLASGSVTTDDLKKMGSYDEKTINEATSKRFKNYSVSRLAFDTLQAASVYHPQGRLDDDYITACVKAHRKLEASGFTTMSLPGILSNVANKTLMAAYMRSPSFIPFVFGRASATNFKPLYSYQLEGSGMLEQLGNDGEIKHGKLVENSYTKKLETYAKMLAFTRKNMIDDDLRALTRVTTMLGEMSFKAREYAATQTIANSTMFSVGNGNLLTGNPLSIDGLTASGVQFDAQVDTDGLPISIDGGRVLAPASLKVVTSQLANQTEIRNTDGTIADSPFINNPHAGTFQGFNTQWLDNEIASAVAGTPNANRSNTWYRFADPMSAPAFEVVYLNNQDTPTIQSADTDFNTLGMQWRCYFDFGFGENDPKYAQKNVGV